jgi:hypothetical protein
MSGIPPAPEITAKEIQLKSWKYVGYKGFSSFISSDNDFLFLRQYGTLHVRVLLALQDEIAILESKLEELDNWASRKERGDLHNGSFRHDRVQERGNLIHKIESKIFRYGECTSVGGSQ